MLAAQGFQESKLNQDAAVARRDRLMRLMPATGKEWRWGTIARLGRISRRRQVTGSTAESRLSRCESRIRPAVFALPVQTAVRAMVAKMRIR